MTIAPACFDVAFGARLAEHGRGAGRKCFLKVRVLNDSRISMSGPTTATPALLMSPYSPRPASRTVFTAALISSGLVTSKRIA